MADAKTIPTEAGHWYHPDGRPCHEVERATGKGTRPATLRDARKLGLLPGVTTILRVMARPGLERWIQRQVLESAATYPRAAGQSDEDYIDAVIDESREASRLAAERGTALHAAVETMDLAGPWADHVRAVERAMAEHGLALETGERERSFACALGFGGKIDWHRRIGVAAVVDWKTKATLETGEGKLVYDEHVAQLAAYRFGLGLYAADAYNVFVAVDSARVYVHRHEPADLERGMAIFRAALELWRLTNRYDGKSDVERDATA